MINSNNNINENININSKNIENQSNENSAQMKTYSSPLKAIKQNCIECMCGNKSEVKNCTVSSCPLFNFRFGKNPFRKNTRHITDEQRAAMGERMRIARKSKNNNPSINNDNYDPEDDDNEDDNEDDDAEEENEEENGN